MKILEDIKDLNYKVVHGTSFGVLTASYIASVIVLAAGIGGFIPFWAALVVITGIIALLQLFGIKDKVGHVEHLVNSQRDQLLSFNQQLIDVIEANGLTVPEEKPHAEP
jgi:hypothetical protein